MIRVLQIVDNIAPDRGVAAVVMNLYRNIDRQKVQFDYLVCSKTEESFEKEIMDKGGNVYYVGNPLSINSLHAAVKNIKDFFATHQNTYTAVHLHSPTIALFTLPFAKKNGIKNRIVHSHSSMTSTNKIKCCINVFLMYAARIFANHYWACSTEAAYFLYKKKYCNSGKYTLIMNAVNPQKYSFNINQRNEYREKYGVSTEKVILHVSNFTKVKNVSFLVPIIKHITERCDDYRFIFVGDGIERTQIENELKNNKYVTFTGRINNVNDYLQMSDILVLPSLKEGLPVSVVEAQACGLSCVISDTITREADVGGVLYLPLDEKKWEQEILRLIPRTIEQRRELAEIYKKSSFNLEREGYRVQNLYLDM